MKGYNEKGKAWCEDEENMGGGAYYLWWMAAIESHFIRSSFFQKLAKSHHQLIRLSFLIHLMPILSFLNLNAIIIECIPIPTTTHLPFRTATLILKSILSEDVIRILCGSNSIIASTWDEKKGFFYRRRAVSGSCHTEYSRQWGKGSTACNLRRKF